MTYVGWGCIRSDFVALLGTDWNTMNQTGSMTQWASHSGIGRVDCDEVDEFLTVLAPPTAEWGWIPELRRTSWIFRGHADSNWKLTPSAWRHPLAPVLQRARDLIASRIPHLTQVSVWDHTGMLPPPPAIDLMSAWHVIVQANGELALLSEFLHRVDELGIDVLGELPPALHHLGVFEAQRPIAADDFLQLRGVDHQAALAQHYGVPTRLLDWTDDPLVAAFFAAAAPSCSERLAVWALNEELASKHALPLWGDGPHGVGLRLRVIRPRRSTNPYLRAQRGAFTVPWGAGCFALVNGGVYPAVEEFASGIAGDASQDVLRCITLPRKLVGDLLQALERRWITLDSLMPSSETVARSIVSRQGPLGG